MRALSEGELHRFTAWCDHRAVHVGLCVYPMVIGMAMYSIHLCLFLLVVCGLSRHAAKLRLSLRLRVHVPSVIRQCMATVCGAYAHGNPGV